MSLPSAFAAARMRSGSPIRIGSIRPRSAEMSAPPRELWSTGQTTAALSGGSWAAFVEERAEMVDRVDDHRRQVPRFGDPGDGRGLDLRGAIADDLPDRDLPDRVDDPGVEHGDGLVALLAADDGDREPLADVDAPEEAQVLRPVERARAGKDIAEHGRDERADPHRRAPSAPSFPAAPWTEGSISGFRLPDTWANRMRSCTEQVRSMLAESPTLSSAQVVLRTADLALMLASEMCSRQAYTAVRASAEPSRQISRCARVDVRAPLYLSSDVTLRSIGWAPPGEHGGGAAERFTPGAEGVGS